MKSIKRFSIVLFFLIIISCLSVFAAECSVGVVEDCTVSADTILDGYPHYLNDTAGNGSIFITTNDVTLNCNGTILQGNSTPNSIGIDISVQDNVTIKNCLINNYSRGISVGNGGHNNNITANSFTNSRGVYCTANQNASISFNIFNNATIYFDGADFSNAHNNNFTCIDSCFDRSEQIHTRNTENITIQFNNFYGSRFGVFSFGNNLNLNISNNTFEFHDRGILLQNDGQSTFIERNTFINNSGNYDQYNLDIHSRNSTYITIDKNNFSESVDVSILYTETNNSVITNNTFDLICIEGRSNYNGNGQNEPCTAIMIKQLFKTHCYGCAGGLEEYSEIIKMSSNNITLDDNSFDSDTYVYTFLQGATNIVHDLTNVWNRSFEMFNISGRSDLLINTAFYEVKNNVRDFNISDLSSLYEGHNLNPRFFFGIKRNEMYFRSPDWQLNLTIFNSTNLGSTSIINISSLNFTMILNETSSQYHLINLPSNGSIKFLYNGRKDFTTINNTITINSMPTTFNQLFNSTSATPTATDVSTFTETIGTNERVIMLTYTTRTQPKLTSIATTVTELNYTFAGNVLTISCEGTGAISLTNMSQLAGSSGFYVHYKDGVDVGNSNSNDYTISGCSSHTFSGVTTLPLSQSSPTSVILLTGILAVIVALGPISIILPIVMDPLNNPVTFQKAIFTFIMVLIDVVLVGVLLQQIFNV